MIKRNILAGAAIGAAMAAVGASSALAQQAPGAAGDRLLDVIVVMDEAFAPGGHAANRSAAASFARGLGLNPRFAYGSALFGFAASIPQAVRDALENNPRVKYVELDGTAFAIAPKHCDNPLNADHPSCKDSGGEVEPTPGGQAMPWGIARIGADTNANTGAGIDVYVLDTGIDIDHPDLGVADEWDCTGGGAFGGGNCDHGAGVADDKNGHGTHVAGTIAARNNSLGVVGVAPDANLYAVQVLGNSGSGSFSGIIAGIDLVAQRVSATEVPAVINMSLGGSGAKNASCNGDGTLSGGEDAFHQAICAATSKGVVVVVAAGNEDDNAANHVPAAYDDTVITVSATSESDDWPFWSNWGNPVAIAAPGVDVLSTWKGGSTKTISGTSMASPHVAGSAALYLANNPQSADFSAYVNTRAALLNTAEETTPANGWSNSSGNPHDEDFLDAGGL